MTFEKILGKLIKKIPGAIGAVFVDYDGESISHFPEEMREQLRLFGAYQQIVCNLVGIHLPPEKYGHVESILVDLSDSRFMMWPINKEYFLVIALSPDALSFTAIKSAEIAVAELIVEMGSA